MKDSVADLTAGVTGQMLGEVCLRGLKAKFRDSGRIEFASTQAKSAFAD